MGDLCEVCVFKSKFSKCVLPMEPLWTLLVKVSKGGPLATTIFHLIGHYSEMSQDIFLKFPAFVHHMPLLN